jgi:integrase/recombinase XerD
MNRTSSGLINFTKSTNHHKKRNPILLVSKAIPGFIQFKGTEGLSPRTIVGYEHDLNLWLEIQGDRDIWVVTTQELGEYMNYMRSEYTPRRITGNNDRKLSSKTLRNIWISLSAFFTWACEDFNFPNPMKGMPAPKYTEAQVETFTKEEVESLLKVCEYCREARTDQRRKFTMRRPTGKRDRAIILTLLDTGLRAGELCVLRIGDVDLKTGRVIVHHGAVGGSKGGKGRTVFIGKTARRAVWRYLADREDGENPEAPLFTGKSNRTMNKDGLRLVINALGKKAKVSKCHPHKFRHTFAITYLRSGGDLFSLKSLLGHNSLEMVEHYARIAEVDVEMAHRRASFRARSGNPSLSAKIWPVGWMPREFFRSAMNF